MKFSNATNATNVSFEAYLDFVSKILYATNAANVSFDTFEK